MYEARGELRDTTTAAISSGDAIGFSSVASAALAKLSSGVSPWSRLPPLPCAPSGGYAHGQADAIHPHIWRQFLGEGARQVDEHSLRDIGGELARRRLFA